MKELFDRPALDAAAEQRMRQCDANMKRLSALPPVVPSTAHDLRAGGDTRSGTPGQIVEATNRRGGGGGGSLAADAGGDCSGVDNPSRAHPVHDRRSSCPSLLERDSSVENFTSAAISGKVADANVILDASQLMDDVDFLGLSSLFLQQQGRQQDEPTTRRTRSRAFVVYDGRRRLSRAGRSFESAVGGPRAVIPAPNARLLPPLKPRGSHVEGTRLH